jgi:hypothetical protein
MIHKIERNGFFCLGFGAQSRLDSAHLAVVRGIGNVQENWLGETGYREEQTDDTDSEEEDFLGLKRVDTYKNHRIYGSYKQWICHCWPGPKK